MPQVVIDGGANMGQWTQMVRPIFPKAEIHLVEPQPACAKVLNDLVRRDPNLKFHPLALTEPGISKVRMIGIGENGGCSGGYVAKYDESSDSIGEIECKAMTLDALLAGTVKLTDRVLLKLDLENHEIPAL